MAYSRKIWIDDSTPLSAQNLNSLERGLELASQQAEDNASDLAGQAVTVQKLSDDVAELSNRIDEKLQQFNNDIITPMRDDITENADKLEDILECTSELEGWSSQVEYWRNTCSENLSGCVSHISDADNPHNVTAEQVGTYSKEVIDQKVMPVKTITGEVTDGNLSFPLADMGYFSSYSLRLSLQGTLWDIVEEELAETSNFDSQSLISDKITNLLVNPEFTWQQVESSIDTTEINTDFLRTLKAIPASALFSTTGMLIDFGLILEEHIHMVLDLFSESLARHYFVSLGKDRAFSIALKDNKLFIKRTACGDQIIIDNISTDLKLETVYIKGGFNNCTISTAELKGYTFLVKDTKGIAASLTNIYSSGSYSVLFNPAPLQLPQKFSAWVEIYGPDNSVFYSLSYLHKESNLSALELNDIFTVEKENIIKDLKTEVGLEVQKLINYGTVDPSSSTPGLVYFKYLPL